LHDNKCIHAVKANLSHSELDFKKPDTYKRFSPECYTFYIGWCWTP